MLFLGTTFLGARYVIDPSPTMTKNVKDIHIENGIFDQLFVSKNPDLNAREKYDDWNYDTVLNADYDDKLDAGNSGFSLRNTEYVIIKCREVGSLNWKVIYTKKINVEEDFKINVNDYFEPSNTNLEYMVVSVCNGIETTYVTKEIKSEFNGLFICDKDNIYGTLYNLDTMDTTRNTQSSTLNLLNNEYASVVSNGKSNYDSGTASGTFIKFNQDDHTINIPDGLKYHTELKNWLANKRPKILKFYDGRIWLISVTGGITDSGDSINSLRKISFDWVEIGTPDSETLYNCDLSDIGREWWH